jgi:Ca-activated chloride channel family protein
MSFSWPWALFALLILPLVFAAWWLIRRRRKRATVRVTSIALVRLAAPGRSRWRRHVPAALLSVGLAVLAIGAARPQATVPEASSSATIMLALDVSGSMCSTDVRPNRITAAEQSAGAFIKSQAGGPRIGIVVFSGTAVVLVPPTSDTQQLLNALGGLSTGGGTAIGEGILTSLDAIAQVDPSVAPTGATVKRNLGAGYADDVVVVLTDGSNNRGVDPPVAAKQAAARGGGGGNPFDADYSALMQISKSTGGTFYRAEDASQLSSALAKLPAAFMIVHRHVDIAALFAALGGLLIAAAVALSLWWNRVRRPASRPEVIRS